jgi:hypothetical protein
MSAPSPAERAAMRPPYQRHAWKTHAELVRTVTGVVALIVNLLVLTRVSGAW